MLDGWLDGWTVGGWKGGREGLVKAGRFDGRQEGGKVGAKGNWREGRKAGRKEGRKERARKEGSKEGRHAGRLAGKAGRMQASKEARKERRKAGSLNRFGRTGIPTRQEYVSWYCELRGIQVPDPKEWAFYEALGFFRIAAILAGVGARAKEGNASSAKASVVRPCLKTPRPESGLLKIVYVTLEGYGEGCGEHGILMSGYQCLQLGYECLVLGDQCLLLGYQCLLSGVEECAWTLVRYGIRL